MRRPGAGGRAARGGRIKESPPATTTKNLFLYQHPSPVFSDDTRTHARTLARTHARTQNPHPGGRGGALPQCTQPSSRTHLNNHNVRVGGTDKVAQHGHDTLSTFGVGADLSEIQLRGVLRQLLAMGAVMVDVQAFNTLVLTDKSRAVLKGDVAVRLRESVSLPAPRKGKTPVNTQPKAPIELDALALLRYADLKAWRAEIAREHNLPAYVIFHDATLAAIAERAPQSLQDLQGISGMGVKKLEAYAQEVLRVVAVA